MIWTGVSAVSPSLSLSAALSPLVLMINKSILSQLYPAVSAVSTHCIYRRNWTRLDTLDSHLED